MPTAAKAGYGIEFWMSPDGETLVEIGELISLKPPAISRPTENATTHESAAAEKIAVGVHEAGEISAQIHYIPGSTADTALRLAVTGGGLQDFKIILPVGTPKKNLIGSGYVTQYEIDDVPVDGKLVANLTITPTGAVAAGAESA